MEKQLYFCHNCKRPFESTNKEYIVCPFCRNDSTIETYNYEMNDTSTVSADDIIVRLDKYNQNWYYTMILNMMQDMFNAESQLRCRCLYVHYYLISVINNCKYMIDKLNEWKRQQLLSDSGGIIYYEGEPGCLISEADWKMSIDLLISVKNDSERVLSTVEYYISDGTRLNVCGTKELNWDVIEEMMTKALRNCLIVYRIFKNGVDIGLRY